MVTCWQSDGEVSPWVKAQLSNTGCSQHRRGQAQSRVEMKRLNVKNNAECKNEAKRNAAKRRELRQVSPEAVC